MYKENQYLIHGLTTERLVLRLLNEQDYDACLPFFEHPLSHQYWNTDNKDPHILCKEWFEKQMWRYESCHGGASAVTDKLSGMLYGWCGLLVQEVDGKWELEVGYSILPDHWGNGYATEASSACLFTGFQRELAGSIISIIQVNNAPSIRVAEKNGMIIDHRTIYHGNQVLIYRRNRQAVSSPAMEGAFT